MISRASVLFVVGVLFAVSVLAVNAFGGESVLLASFGSSCREVNVSVVPLLAVTPGEYSIVSSVGSCVELPVDFWRCNCSPSAVTDVNVSLSLSVSNEYNMTITDGYVVVLQDVVSSPSDISLWRRYRSSDGPANWSLYLRPTDGVRPTVVQNNIDVDNNTVEMVVLGEAEQKKLFEEQQAREQEKEVEQEIGVQYNDVSGRNDSGNATGVVTPMPVNYTWYVVLAGLVILVLAGLFVVWRVALRKKSVAAETP